MRTRIFSSACLLAACATAAHADSANFTFNDSSGFVYIATAYNTAQPYETSFSYNGVTYSGLAYQDDSAVDQYHVLGADIFVANATATTSALFGYYIYSSEGVGGPGYEPDPDPYSVELAPASTQFFYGPLSNPTFFAETINFADGLSLNIDADGPPPAAAPEPSSLALLGSGLLGSLGVLRRRWNS